MNDDIKAALKTAGGIAAVTAGVGAIALGLSVIMNPDDKKEIKDALRKKVKDSVIGKINPSP